MSTEESLGERIKKARKKSGLSGSALAEKIGVTQAYVSALETGRRAGSPEVLKKIAQALDTSTAYLIGETDDPSPAPKRLSWLPPPKGPAEPGTVDAEIEELEKVMLEREAKDPGRLFHYIEHLVKHREEMGPNDKAFVVALLKWGIAYLEGKPEGTIENFPGEDWDDEF